MISGREGERVRKRENSNLFWWYSYKARDYELLQLIKPFEYIKRLI